MCQGLHALATFWVAKNLELNFYALKYFDLFQLTCTPRGNLRPDWRDTLDCWDTDRTCGPSLSREGGWVWLWVWIKVPERGVSSLHRHWPGPSDWGSKSSGTSMHSWWWHTIGLCLCLSIIPTLGSFSTEAGWVMRMMSKASASLSRPIMCQLYSHLEFQSMIWHHICYVSHQVRYARNWPLST